MIGRARFDSGGSDSAIESTRFRRVALLLLLYLFQHIFYRPFREQGDQSIHRFLPLQNDWLGARFAYLYTYSYVHVRSFSLG